MLGAELETYKGNKVFMALMVILGLLPAFMLVLAFVKRPPDPALGITALLLLAGPLLLFIWLISIRVTLHNDGISYHSLFGKKEMRWDAVDRFYYGAIRTSINLIPVGTTYYFKLVDAEGKKLALGHRVDKPDKLGPKLIQLSYPALFKKLAEQFNSGQELDFGRIRLSRAGGVKVKKIFRYEEIPWNQVASWSIHQGHFHIFRVGQKRSFLAPSLREIPNAFVLDGLLNSILKRRQAA